MHRSKVTSKGQIVIPVALREKYHIQRGTPVTFVEEDNRLYMVPVTVESIRRMMGSMKDLGGKSAVKTLKEERRKDALKEEAKYRRWMKH